MRILFVSQYFYPENFSNNKIVKDLVERGHDVTVLCGIPNYPEGRFFDGYGFFRKKKEDFFGAKIERVSLIPRGSSGVQLAVNYASFAVTGSWKALFMKFNQYDVIFCSALSPITIALPAMVAAWKTKAPCFLWVQDVWPHTPLEMLGLKSPFVKKPLEILCRWIYGAHNDILVPSLGYVDPIKLYASLNTRFHFFPNSIEEFHKPLPRTGVLARKLGITDKAFVVVYAGNIGVAQNAGVVVDAAALLKDASIHFVFLGEGRDKARIEKTVVDGDLEDQFHFLGEVSPEEVVEILAEADAAVLTLADQPVFHLTAPYRLQSYLGCGKLVLGSVGGESARIIEEANCGFVSPPGSAEKLAINIARAKNSTQEERQFKEKNARAYALTHYQQGRVMDALEELMLQHNKD